MRLGHTFFSLFLVLIISFVVVNWLLDEYWRTHSVHNVDNYTGYFLVLDALDDSLKELPRSEWTAFLAEKSERYNLNLEFLSNDKIDAGFNVEEVVKIADVQIYVHGETYDIVREIPKQEYSLIISSISLPTRPKLEGTVRFASIAFISLALFFWVWPMSRDLDKLEKAAVEFGQGDFKSEAETAFTPLIAPLVDTFNMMAYRINRLIEAHKELTNAVSHELRTPVARTKFALEMIRNAKSEEQRDKYLNKIAFDVAEQEELINELLLYASFEDDRPRLTWSEMDLHDVASALTQNFSQFPVNIEVKQPETPVTLEGDRHFIERALNNLLSNAVKYGDGEIHISVSADRDSGHIVVEDNGEGVDDEFKEVIFDAFSRGDESRTKDTGGFGLGLAIVGRIMQWHGGHVSVSDSDLGGAKFTLSWPFKNRH